MSALSSNQRPNPGPRHYATRSASATGRSSYSSSSVFSKRGLCQVDTPSSSSWSKKSNIKSTSVGDSPSEHDPLHPPRELLAGANEQHVSSRHSSGAWTPSADRTLMSTRQQGMNWTQIQQAYFPSKTPNACRKRHERLMERSNADDWDGLKVENHAKNYMGMRHEIWAGLAAQVGEQWNVVEQKCMSQGLENLQTLARSGARREHIPGDSSENDTPSLYGQSSFHGQDSGFGSMTSSNGLQESHVMPLHAPGIPRQLDIEASFTPKLLPIHENPDAGEPLQDKAIKISDLSNSRHTSQNRISSRGVDFSHPPCLDGTNTLTSETISSQINETSSEDSAPRIVPAENHPCKGKRSSSEGPTIAPYATGTTSQSEAPKFNTSINSCHGARSPDSNLRIPLELQRGSSCTHEDAISSADSSTSQAYGNESDSSYEDLQTESARQHFILISFISALRYKLYCQLMQAFRIKFGSEWTARGIRSTGNTSSGSISRGNASTNTSSPSSSAREGSQIGNKAKIKATGKKRSAEDDGEDHDDGGSSKRSRKEPSDFRSPPERRKFPCPYYKLDPITFGNSVCEHGWPDIAKLKEHVYRKHYNEYQCQRCKANFSSRTTLDDHAELTLSCQPKKRSPKDGITFEIWLMLKNKTKSFPGYDDRDKWTGIYRMLFPFSESVPDPFGESSYSGAVQPHFLEGFRSRAIQEEVGRRAAMEIANTVRPLETQLFAQLPSIVHDAEMAIDARYQRHDPGDISHDSSRTKKPVSCSPTSRQGDALPHLPENRNSMEFGSANLTDCLLDFSDYSGLDFTLDMLNTSTTTHATSNLLESSDAEYSTSVPCLLCMSTVCVCPRHVRRSGSPPGIPEVSPRSDVKSMMNMMQNMYSAIQSLDRRLQAAEFPSRQFLPQL